MAEVRDHRTLGRIVVRAIGHRADSATAFSVSISGPRAFRDRAGFGSDGLITFSGLAAGEYRLVADSKADTLVRVAPRELTVRSRARRTVEIELEFS